VPEDGSESLLTLPVYTPRMPGVGAKLAAQDPSQPFLVCLRNGLVCRAVMTPENPADPTSDAVLSVDCVLLEDGVWSEDGSFEGFTEDEEESDGFDSVSLIDGLRESDFDVVAVAGIDCAFVTNLVTEKEAQSLAQAPIYSQDVADAVDDLVAIVEGSGSVKIIR
jgi:hypothetical protein